MGCLFPKAENPGAYWANIKNGVDAITEVPETHWRPADYFDADPKSPDRTYGRRGGFLSPIAFNPLTYNLPPNTLEAIDTSQLLGLVAAGQALTDAGYGNEREFDRDRVSVILGVTGALELVIPLGARLGHPLWRQALKEAGVEEGVAEDVIARIGDAYVPWQENSFPGLLGNVVAGRISKQFDLGGTNCVVDAACGSSLAALNLASLELASGRADLVVSGGVDTFNDIFMYMCFSKTPALSPSGHARPFDADGDGTTLGEGLGVVVLKRLADAERDNDRIYAVIRGIGSSSDGKGEAIYAPSAVGQKKALLEAYRTAEIAPRTVELVEAHGTGTKVGDAVEVSALREVFGDAESPWCALGSVKSQIGHTKAAAGAAGLIKASLALHHKVLPPTIKVNRPLPEVSAGGSPFYVNAGVRPWLPRADHPRRAAVSALGFGGSNFHCIVEEYGREKSAPDWDGEVQILAFSGNSSAEIVTAMAGLSADTPWSGLRAAAAASRAAFRADAPCRLALVVERGRTNLANLLNGARTMLSREPQPRAWTTPDGAFFASGERVGKLGFVFPGQGAQYTGMLRDLSVLFPEMLGVLAEADTAYALEPGAAGRLSDLIYPPHPFDAAVREAQEQRLRATDVAQPAIGAVSLGALRVLDSFGVSPEAAAGHSYGELTALCAAGCFDAQSLHLVSRLRGRLMAEGGDDKGGMLAVSAPLETVATLIQEEGLDLVLANKNAPGQAVLSGASAEITRAAEILGRRNITCKPLPVAAAFHSPLVAEASIPFAARLAEVPFHAALIPVFSNTTADEYPADVDDARKLLASQLAAPVEFVAEVENMYRRGVRTFLEVGPGARLTGLVKSILGEREYEALAIDASAGKRSGVCDLARALAQLAVLGHGVKLAVWDEGFRPETQAEGKKPLMTVPLCGANYMKPRPKRPPVPPRSAASAPAAAAPATPAAAPRAAQPSENLAALLRLTQENMTALQRLQEQTAQLHRQFLDGQETAGRTFHALLEQQQRLLAGGLSVPVPPPVVTAPVPAASYYPPKSHDSHSSHNSHGINENHGNNGTTAATVLLAVVSEKTGYPAEMLELDMTLDADLGIDSIKRVEILSSLQERLPGAPQVTPDQLATLQTLRQIADYLGAGVATAVSHDSHSSHESHGMNENNGNHGTPAATVLLAVVSEKTGYPVEMLELDMTLDADLGIDSIKRVEILSLLQERLPHAPKVTPDQLATLQTLRQIADYLGAGQTVAVSHDSHSSHDTHGINENHGNHGTPVATVLLEVVSEKTGYPVEMLELDMTLDADLGIDSIKRVEILSLLQERLPHAPKVTPDQLATLQTLRQIADYLGAGAAPATAVSQESPTSHDSHKTPETTTVAGIARSILTAVPLADVGESPAVTVSAADEIWVVEDGAGLAAAVTTRLLADGRRSRVIPGLDPDGLRIPERLGGLLILPPVTGCDDLFHIAAFRLLQQCASALQRAAAATGSVVLTVSRLDGRFGLARGSRLVDPLSGGLSALAKTARHEWPGVTCKALDLAGSFSIEAAAEAICGELLSVGPVEVGLCAEGRCGLELVPAPFSGERSAPPLTAGDLVLVSGGARGVTAEVAVALAASCRPTLVLLGRSGAPEAEPEWLAGLGDEAAVKRALVTRAPSGTSPKKIDDEYRRIAANREMLATLARIAACGAVAAYRSVDVREPAAVATVVAEVRRQYGPVRGMIHGAGVLADRLITDKTPEQFQRVYATKIAGLRSILAAVGEDELRFMALFSSSTGRFGRTGQVDYAVANEVLNKIAQNEARLRPGCRVSAINWGPWDGGMVNASLKKVFAGEGVEVIGLSAGADTLLREISLAPGEGVETVVLGAAAEMSAAAAPVSAPPRNQALAEAVVMELSVERFPFLASHVMNGRAVLPVAMMVEWLSHGALHGNPGLRFHGFDDLRVLKGVTFSEHAPCTLRVLAGKAAKREAFYVVPVELRGDADGAAGSILHARAEIVLANRLPEGIRSITDRSLAPYPHADGPYGGGRLFHGPTFQGIEAVTGCGPEGITALVKAAPAPAQWIASPLRTSWLSDPLALDGSFQMMILWSLERSGAGSLPTAAGRYRQFQEFPPEGTEVVVRVEKEGSHSAVAVMEYLDRQTGKLVARLEGYECVIDGSLAEAFRRNRLSPADTLERGAA
jgi:acyl transferase domain-containing protein